MRFNNGHCLERCARTAGTLTGIILLMLAASSCLGRGTGPLETITLGLVPLEQNALIYVADDNGFFAGNGLKIVIKNYDSGVTAIDGMLKGEADLAGAAEFPVVRAIFQKEPIKVLVSSDKFENDYLVGRKDRGIAQVSDLKGKRIGVARQTINEFYLGRLLQVNGINLPEVTLVDLQPAQCVIALTGGEVDAIIAWQPYIHQILERQPNVVVWPAQSNQLVYGLLVCRNEWLAQHGATSERFVKSLGQAEDYLVAHPDQAQAIVQRRLNYDSAYVAEIWPQHQLSLSLDLSLIAAMTDEAHWLINNRLTPEKVVPDFPNYIYTRALQAVKPDAVNIDH